MPLPPGQNDDGNPLRHDCQAGSDQGADDHCRGENRARPVRQALSDAAAPTIKELRRRFLDGPPYAFMNDRRIWMGQRN